MFALSSSSGFVATERPAEAPLPDAVAIPTRWRLHIVDESDARRQDVEAFIARIYGLRFGASVRQWAPTLAVLSCNGRFTAAAGYRRASEPLYLERYLSQPVEAAITAEAGRPVARDLIVEVGHFVSAEAGHGRRLIPLLTEHLAAAGCCWAAVTATRELRAMFVRMGMHAVTLAPADPARLGRDAAAWGKYYDHAPVVIAGDLHRNCRIIASTAA